MPSERNEDESACRFCQSYVPAGASYCGKCGAHLDLAVFPCLQDSLEHQQRKVRVYTALFAAGAFLFIYGGSFVVMIMDDIQGNSGAAYVVATMGICLMLYLGFKAEEATRGIKCPACGEAINQWLLKQDVSHCYKCGTRILAGKRSRATYPDRMSAATGEQCGFCGEPSNENQIYCYSCGSNLAWEIRHEDGSFKIVAEAPKKRFCPVCRRPANGVPRKDLNYCPGCGVRIIT